MAFWVFKNQPFGDLVGLKGRPYDVRRANLPFHKIVERSQFLKYYHSRMKLFLFLFGSFLKGNAMGTLIRIHYSYCNYF